jgi:TolA-binding protein
MSEDRSKQGESGAGDEAEAKRLLDEGIALVREGKLAPAIGRLLDVVSRYPASAVADNAHYNLGMIYEKLGQKQKAHAEYETVDRCYPGSDAAMFARDRMEALKDAADPAHGLYVEAEDHYRHHRYPDAIRCFEEICRKHAGSRLIDNAYLALATIQAHHGDRAEAERLLKKLREDFPGSDAARLAADIGRTR